MLVVMQHDASGDEIQRVVDEEPGDLSEYGLDEPKFEVSFRAADMAGVPPFWVGALGKFQLVEQDGRRVLLKTNDNPFLKRTKVFFGDSGLHDYTVTADFRSTWVRRPIPE